jgi:predicted MFS family arabinose efflux permease
MLMSVLIFLVIVLMVQSQTNPNPMLSYALLAIGAMTVLASFLLKQQLTRKAIDNNDVAALQSAHIVSLALCESAALLGVLDRFVTGSTTSWLLFAIAVLGILLHFPKKDHLRAVSYKG